LIQCFFYPIHSSKRGLAGIRQSAALGSRRLVTSRLDVDVMGPGSGPPSRRAPRGRRAAVSPAAPTWPPATRTAADHPAPASPPVFASTATGLGLTPLYVLYAVCLRTERAYAWLSCVVLYVSSRAGSMGRRRNPGGARGPARHSNSNVLAHEGCLVVDDGGRDEPGED
jgi:hypothetical protein